MVFWGIAGLLTLICVVLLIWPLLKQSTGRESNTDYNMKVYEDQLSEVDRDFELGRVNSKELASIKTEIQRRILTENDTAKKYEEPKQFSPSTYIYLLSLFLCTLFYNWNLRQLWVACAPRYPIFSADRPFARCRNKNLYPRKSLMKSIPVLDMIAISKK